MELHFHRKEMEVKPSFDLHSLIRDNPPLLTLFIITITTNHYHHELYSLYSLAQY